MSNPKCARPWGAVIAVLGMCLLAIVLNGFLIVLFSHLTR